MELTAFTPPAKAGGVLMQMLRIMKLTSFLLIVFCLQASAKSYSQVITLAEKNVPLKKIFREVHRQTGYEFFYNADLVDNAGTVSIEVKNATVEQVLALCFKDKPFTFTIKDKAIVIKASPAVTSSPAGSAATAALITIRGRITNEKGEPVIASITVKGSTMGTTSNAEGYFELKGVAENATLIISGIGIETREWKVNGKTDLGTLQVKIKADAAEEVEVTYNTGFQYIPKERATGSFVHIDNELFNRRVGANVLDRITDIASGVLQSNVTGFTIRGISSISAGRRPLVVVDNFPLPEEGPDFINTINPNDVATITILKDAAAASIWGARAGNGVIVITTKKGKFNQRPQMQLVSNVTIGEKPDLFYIPFLSSKDQVTFERSQFNKGLYNDYDDLYPSFNYFPSLPQSIEILLAARRGAITQQEAEAQLAVLEQHDVRRDIEKYMMQTSISQQYAFNVSGGGDKYAYYASVGYDRMRAGTVKDHNNRLTLNVGNSYRPLKNLELRGTISYAANQGSATGLPYNSLMGGRTNSIYSRLVDDQGRPLAIPMQYRTAYVDTATFPALLDWHYRPLDELNYRSSQSRGYNARLMAGIGYTIIHGIQVEAQYQYNRILFNSRNHLTEKSFDVRSLVNRFMDVNSLNQIVYPYPLGDQLSLISNESYAWNGRVQLIINRSWDKHQLNAIAGMEMGESGLDPLGSQTFYGYNPATTIGQLPDAYGLYNSRPEGYMTRLGISNNFQVGGSLTRNGSEFANVGYTYNKKYVFSASGRIDRSNFFGVKANQRQVPLWSAGAVWKLSEESFYKLSWLPGLSLRASYGFSGNTNSGASAYTTIRYISNSPSSIPVNSTFSRILTPPNPQLKWERVKQVNIGLDFGFRNQRVSGSLEFYTKRGLDLIGPVDLDPTTGLFNFTGNRASIKGKGVDFTLHTNNLTGAFSWASDFIFSYNTDEVIEYLGQQNYNGQSLIGGQPVTGKSLTSLYAYRWAGLDPLNGDPRIYLDDTVSAFTNFYQAKREDVVYIGNGNPTFFGSFRNSFSYRQLSVSVNIIYRLNYYFRRSSAEMSGMLTTWSGHADYLKRWQKPGDELITDVPSLPSFPDERDGVYRDANILVEKGDHIRLQDVRVDYRFDGLSNKGLPFKSAQLYVYANNLGILWRANNKRIDPDAAAFGMVPAPKTFALGVNLSF